MNFEGPSFIENAFYDVKAKGINVGRIETILGEQSNGKRIRDALSTIEYLTVEIQPIQWRNSKTLAQQGKGRGWCQADVGYSSNRSERAPVRDAVKKRPPCRCHILGVGLDVCDILRNRCNFPSGHNLDDVLQGAALHKAWQALLAVRPCSDRASWLFCGLS